jgi:hypothetical protein
MIGVRIHCQRKQTHQPHGTRRSWRTDLLVFVMRGARDAPADVVVRYEYCDHTDENALACSTSNCVLLVHACSR